jgi:hypothetical protein
MATLTKAIQDELAALLAALPSLAGVPVIGRRRGIIANDIEAEVSKLGACLYVFPALPIRVNKNLPGPYVEQMEIRVRVIEIPSMNSTLPDAHELVEIVLRTLHHRKIEAVPGENEITVDELPIRDVEDPDAVVMDVIFSVSTGYPDGPDPEPEA